MRLRISLIVLALCASACVCAADKPQTDIPIYPGGEATMEINLTSEELVPMLQTLLPMLSGKVGELAEKIKPEDVAEALRNLRRLQFVQVDVPRTGASVAEIMRFYSNNLPLGSWSRAYFQSAQENSVIAVYCLEGFRGLYGFRITAETSNGKPIYRVTAGRIEGMIDFVALMKAFAGAVIPDILK